MKDVLGHRETFPEKSGIPDVRARAGDPSSGQPVTNELAPGRA